MPAGEPTPDGWKGAFLVAWGRGLTVQQAAEAAGIGVSTVYGQKLRDPAFAAEWESAKDMRKLLRADKAWKVVDQILDDPDHKDRLAAAKLTIDKNESDAPQQVEIQVEVQHVERRTLADLLVTARSLDGLGSGARGELPAARALLPAPDESQ